MRELKVKPKARSEEISSLKKKLEEVEQRCSEAEEALDAIRKGEVDALVIYGEEGEKIYTIQGAETTYRLMIETINEGAATLIDDGTILYCNRRFAELINYPLEAIIGTTIYEYIPHGDRATFASLLDHGINEACPKDDCRGEIDLLRKDGSTIPAMISLNNFSTAGSPGVCMIASDLTEHMKVEELTLQNAIRAETLSEYARSLVEASLDEQSIVKVAIRTAIQLIGDVCIVLSLAADDHSLPITAHYHPDPEIDQSIDQFTSRVAFQTNKALARQGEQNEKAILIPSIKSIPENMLIDSELLAFINQIEIISLLIVPIRTQKLTIGTLSMGRLEGSHPYTRDDLDLAKRIANQAALAITNAWLYRDLQEVLEKEQTMRLQLIQTEKLSALSRMMATVVHEINNPVQTIKNCIYLIKVDTPADSPLVDTLNMADSEIDRMANLVSTLRNIYRQPKNMKMESLNIVKLLSDVHTMLDHHLLHQNVTWQQELPAEPLWIYGIADHLKQVFLNISMNAIEAMQPGGGTITVSAIGDAIKNEVAVAIKDTGPGINPKDVEKLFEPFYTTKEGGSGLGLSICYEIVQKHSGSIKVDSQLGKGATFTISLPCTPPPE